VNSAESTTRPTLDELSWQVISELQEDGRRSYREISERLGVSPGTVRTRVLDLIRDGFVRVIAVPNSWRLGYRFHATVGLRLLPGHVDEVADLLSTRPEVGWIGLTMNRFDLLFEVTLEDGRAFGRYKKDFLAPLPGCVEIEVFEIWDVKKFRYELSELQSSANGRRARQAPRSSPRSVNGTGRRPRG
jgi:Lrp/AsnC family transcriptional regulator for asnA, asnC and gidA